MALSLPVALSLSKGPGETSLEYTRPHRPLPVRLINAACRLGLRAGLPGADLLETSLLSAACRKTGLWDFGDLRFRKPLKVLLASMQDEARLHPAGRIMARHNLVRILSNRLRMEDAITRHPGILAADMQDPVVLTGLQRTGTTLLHRLLAEDPSFRVLASWEAVNPAPWPGTTNLRKDPRIRAARFAQRSVGYLSPDFSAIHPIEAESPEEDVLLLEFAFLSTVPEAMMRVPAYSRWLEEEGDNERAYRYLEKILKLLLWQRSAERWLLKSPHHLEHLDVLLDVFPDARIIQVHRDPVVSLASYCSMLTHAQHIFSDEVDPHEVARHWSAKRARLVERAMATRERVGADRFIDVQYVDLVSDPIEQVRRIYAFLGRSLGAGTEARMHAYMRENPKHKHGKHRYGLEHFGLDRETEEERFSRYRARFHIPVEDGA
ncbi:MAG: sulfotransferase [Deltaproteobacteria bacterium]|nr:sulfotransferase [Deltaproteobacteria bacterium]